jgi:hypothetical protein
MLQAIFKDSAAKRYQTEWWKSPFMQRLMAIALCVVAFTLMLSDSGHAFRRSLMEQVPTNLGEHHSRDQKTLTHAALAQRQNRTKRYVRRVSDKWYKFTGPDGDFTLSLPAKPTREPDGQGPTTVIRAYGLTTQTGMQFSVVFQDVGGNPSARSNNEWGAGQEQQVAAAARNNGERVIQIHRLSKNVIELELRQLVPQTGVDLNYLRRDILRRGRTYTLGCGSVNGNDMNKSICRRFFESMRFPR